MTGRRETRSGFGVSSKREVTHPRRARAGPSAPRELDFVSLVDAICQVHEQCASQATRAINTALTLRNWAIGVLHEGIRTEGPGSRHLWRLPS